jgi:hypothetical protein
MGELALSAGFVLFVFAVPFLFAAGVFLTLMLAAVSAAPVARKLEEPDSIDPQTTWEPVGYHPLLSTLPPRRRAGSHPV